MTCDVRRDQAKSEASDALALQHVTRHGSTHFFKIASFRVTRATSCWSVLTQNSAKLVFLYFGEPMRSITLESQAGGVFGFH